MNQSIQKTERGTYEFEEREKWEVSESGLHFFPSVTLQIEMDACLLLLIKHWKQKK